MLIRKNIDLTLVLAFFLFVTEALFYGVKNNVSLYLVTVIVFMSMVLLLKPDDITSTMFFMLPNQRLFTIPGTDFSLINLIVLAIFIALVVNGKIKHNKQMKFLYVAVLVYSMWMAYVHDDVIMALQVLKTISMFVVLSYIFFKNNEKREKLIYSCILFFVLGVIATNFLGLVFDPAYSFASVTTKLRFSGGDFNNPNIIGFDISFAISLVFVHLFYTNRKILISISSLIILIPFGLMTQSRSFFFSLLFMSAFFLVSSILVAERKKIYLFGILIAVICIVIFSAKDLSYGLFSSAYDRILNPKNGDISAGRFIIWTEYASYLLNYKLALFFGSGIQNVNETFGIAQVAHNAVLEVIISWGIIGCILFASFFVVTYKKMKITFSTKNIRRKGRKYGMLVRYLPLYILLLSSVTGHSFLSNPFIVKFFISSFFAQYYSRGGGPYSSCAM